MVVASVPPGDALAAIQAFAFPRRIRVKEFFLDFDPLRCGRCTQPQFIRALSMTGIDLSKEQVDALVRYFTEQGAVTHVPQVVNYERFCGAIDRCFSEGRPLTAGGELGTSQHSHTSPASAGTNFSPRVVDDTATVGALMGRLAMLCKTRGVVLKYCFQDIERSSPPSPARVTPRMAGKVTVPQFMRLFPFRKDFTDQEMQMIVERYQDKGGDVHFMALHADVTSNYFSGMPPIPRSDLILRPDRATWTHHSLSPVGKIQAKVVEKRIRLEEHFKDFDALRKGFCTVGQVKTVFAILNLTKELDAASFDELTKRYVRDDGLFCYADFCAEVDCAFTLPYLEAEPLARTTMPDASTTAPARRNRMVLEEQRRQECADIEEKIRHRVQVRRILLKPAFQDMDRTARGHVTRGQFGRVMCMLGFELEEVALERLCEMYCDLGNHTDFNYLDFCRACDPPSSIEVQHAAKSWKVVPKEPAKYFDMRGSVHTTRKGTGLLSSGALTHR